MKDKSSEAFEKVNRFILRYMFGLDVELQDQIPPEEEQYYWGYILEWRCRTKGRFLQWLWFVTLTLAIGSFIDKHFLDGWVFLYGLIRLTFVAMDTSVQDYLDEKKKRNWGSE